uniref:Plant heme peroxidase family profile domain-containing protein n=1 Tax=Glycine max TaxID=3847 RepID=K7LNL4_SOYBN
MVEPIVVDEEYRKEIEMARRELGVFITNNKCAPLMLQFAWNDAATYDAKSRRGGPNGSIRLRIGQELKHEANKGLEKAVQYCEIVKTKLKLKKVSYANLYQDSNESPRTEGRFIDGEEDARNLRKIFSRMGLSDEQDIVALCGGHTLIRTMYPKVSMGETHKDRSKFEEGKSTNKPLKFDNSYFKELLIKDASFSRLPMDYALVEDPKFHHYVERYDEEIFFKEYAISHKKLSELGFNLNNLDQPKGPYAKLNQHKGLIGIGIASVVVTVILGYLLKRKKNQLKN